MDVTDVLFLAAALIAVASGALAVTRENPVYGALFMMVTLLAVAGTFLMLMAPFLAVMQVLLYGGAIMVLFTFVIMLLSLRPHEMGETPPIGQRVLAAAVALGIFALLAVPAIDPGLPGAAESFGAWTAPAVTFAGEGVPPTPPVELGGTEYFGRALFGRFLVPFELVSVLVLAAIVAVMVLAKRDLGKREERDDPRGGHDDHGDHGDGHGGHGHDEAHATHDHGHHAAPLGVVPRSISTMASLGGGH